MDDETRDEQGNGPGNGPNTEPRNEAGNEAGNEPRNGAGNERGDGAGNGRSTGPRNVAGNEEAHEAGNAAGNEQGDEAGNDAGNEAAPRTRTWRERLGHRARRERVGRRAWVRPAALVGSGLIVGALVAGTVTAHAADGERRGGDSSTSREDGRPGHGGGHRGSDGDRNPPQSQRDDEELLTGNTAEQVREAVLAEYPDATIQRVETDAGGDYEAHIVTADDERLIVLVDEDFEVTGTDGD